ncbi:MAG: hypothetical protein GKS06_01310 [Acidobacteria bacterium]|nr:hypothetical protein [Acidobacteriota bacterium]
MTFPTPVPPDILALMLTRRHLPWATLVLVLLLTPSPANSRAATSVDRAIANAELIDREMGRARRAAEAFGPVAPRQTAARRRLTLTPGDSLTASTANNKVLQVKAGTGKVVSSKVKGGSLEPRGVDYHPGLGLMAIAAVNQVVLWDPAAGKTTPVPGPDGGDFEFASDVLFDRAGGLVIADQGEELGSSSPTDGAVWRYGLETGELIQIATGKALVNPKLLARTKKGVIHIVDGSGGPLVSPVTEARWDAVYLVEGKNLTRVKPVWTKPGVQATAYAISDSGWHWVVNVGELVRFKGKKFEQRCLPPFPMTFGTGVFLNADGTAAVMDGANVVTKDRALLTLAADCTTTGKADRKLKGARGLTHVPAE